MSNEQKKIIEKIFELTSLLKNHELSAELIGNYLKKLAYEISDEDQTTRQLDELNSLFNQMREQNLPATRLEFESRAVLFVVLNEVERFIKLKQTYHSHKQVKTINFLNKSLK
jgi:uncharacterized membrane protein YgaE (UPF0421/DUF939 family)